MKTILFIIPAGTSDRYGNMSELVVNGKAQKLLEYLETVFDIVIIDTTPVLAITDAYTISSWCDATVYVIRHAFTPKIHVQRLDDNAELHRIKNTGHRIQWCKEKRNWQIWFGMATATAMIMIMAIATGKKQ